MNIRGIGIVVAVGWVALSGPARAQPYDMTWHTLDAGGATFSTGGVYSVGGTVGQSDASSFAAPMTGGSYALVGGFWPAANAACSCPGDMNMDGHRNGRDVQQFARCLVGGAACDCADVDGVPGLAFGDVTVFVADLLADATCP